MKFKLSMFSLDLPESRIANKPASEREDAKLMIVHKNSGENCVFKLSKLYILCQLRIIYSLHIFLATNRI